MPALLSFVSLGGAAAARVAVTKLLLPLFLFSVVFLGYAHYRVWVRKIGHPTAKIILVINTALIFLLWAWRLPF